MHSKVFILFYRLQVEKERGITVKAQTASLFYRSTVDDQLYLLNLIDTPGHVDFSNEVSRSLSACQGVILLVDANQGVQAQTVANFYLAFCKDLVIIPVLNKVDLKNANPKKVEEQLHCLFEMEPETILRVINIYISINNHEIIINTIDLLFNIHLDISKARNWCR